MIKHKPINPAFIGLALVLVLISCRLLTPESESGVDVELTLEKRASPATYDQVGDQITYTYTSAQHDRVVLVRTPQHQEDILM